MGFHTKQLRTMLVEALEKGKEVDQIISFLAKAKSAGNFFGYRVSYNTDGNILGVFWKTGTMRQHSKGGLLDVIMLDMMKRQIKSANFPYCVPVMMTGKNGLVCACEAIVISENLSAYAWIMNSIYSMSGLPCSVTKLVFGDRMPSANLLKDLGIEHMAKLILYQYHLKEDWKKKFGGSWQRFSHLIIALIEAYAESEYMVALENLRVQVESQDLRKYIVEKIHPIR